MLLLALHGEISPVPFCHPSIAAKLQIPSLLVLSPEHLALLGRSEAALPALPGAVLAAEPSLLSQPGPPVCGAH